MAQDDTDLLAEMPPRLSARTRHYRYFTFHTPSLAEAWREAARIARGHEGSQLAVATTGPRPGGDEAVAVAELVPDSHLPTNGHPAVVAHDNCHGRGVGTAPMRQRLTLAQASDVATVRADLLAENHAARRLPDRLGLHPEARTRHGETQVSARLDTPAAGADA